MRALKPCRSVAQILLYWAGMIKRTQHRSVRMLVDFYGKTPDLINELKLQDYFLHRKNVDKWSPATMRICYRGINDRSTYLNVSGTPWSLSMPNGSRACPPCLASITSGTYSIRLTPLKTLRSYWKHHRNPLWFFPRLERSGIPPKNP